jgi:peptidoglycan/xylan/chitin deacetylase (PgdA/CDA1 family)
MRIGLKVDVATLRGTREGVPALVELFRRHGVGATFLFTLGPDRTGRAIGRAFQPGFAGKVRRTGAIEHYGVKTLMYGTLLPAPDIARRAGDVMRMTRDAGFETGVHGYDRVRWLGGVATADAAWTEREMRHACERYTDVFKEPPLVHGAAGWQMNVHALRLTQRLGYEYCSDGRGTHPHLPFWSAEPVRCPQFPTTLPTLDELIGVDGVGPANVADRVLGMTEAPSPAGHVFTLHAELEGLRLPGVLEQLITGWKAQGWSPGSVRSLYESAEPLALPRCTVGIGSIPGRSGTLFVQQGPFPGEALPRAA